MIILSPDIKKYPHNVGNKTLHLTDLLEQGLNVPAFVAIPNTTIEKVFSNTGSINTDQLNRLIQLIISALPCKCYAVRSSALIEDGEQTSFAGQFLTKTNIKASELSEAITVVVHDALDRSHIQISQFSILIQEYIVADIAGVTFTRNPAGSRDMLLEFHSGPGEAVVGGKVKPQRAQFYWSELPNVKLPKISTINSVFKKIEQFYNWPQDIEWCIKDNRWYWLQTRPITTITTDQYNNILYLDKNLPLANKFYYRKTELSEIAPRPHPLTLDILKYIYSATGPIAKVYQSHQITYSVKNFLTILGNELYIDKEQELHTLLPAYSYFLANKSLTTLQPKLILLNSLIRTLKNIYYLNRLSVKNYQSLFTAIKEKLTAKNNSTDIDTLLQTFLQDYQIIFEINLLADKSIQNLKQLLQKESVKISSLLNCALPCLSVLDQYNINISTEWYGNSLDIADESKFVAHLNNSLELPFHIEQWWLSLPVWKKRLVEPALQTAAIYNRLREFGRWLVIKDMNTIRQVLLQIAEKNNFNESRNIYFATLTEIANNTIDELTCLERKKNYAVFNNLQLPNILTSFIIQPGVNNTTGVSSGLATGVLVTTAMLDTSTAKEQTSKILYTQSLTPNLVQYFNQISGIISETGGILSHLAIMAREQHIPVIVNVDLHRATIQLGDLIDIDGDSGKIVKHVPLSP